MELIKKSGFKTCLNIVVSEIYNEIRNDLILIVCSKVGIVKIGLVIVALI